MARAALELAREASQLVRRNDPGARMLTPSPTAGMRGVRWLDAYLRGVRRLTRP